MLPGTAIGLVFALVVAFQVKHLLGDFPLQTQYMLVMKGRPGWEFVGPLALHCGVHSGLALVIILAVNPRLWWLALIDFGVHFVMDRIKSGPRYLGRYDDYTRPAFWNCLGVDQLVHHLTSYCIIWRLVDSLYSI